MEAQLELRNYVSQAEEEERGGDYTMLHVTSVDARHLWGEPERAANC